MPSEAYRSEAYRSEAYTLAGRARSRGRVFLWLALSMLASTMVWWPVPRSFADAAAEDAFKRGIAAADLGRFDEAAVRLREAIAADPRESDRRVLITGLFSRPYLPHYYLGDVLIQSGLEHCTEALDAWKTSERQGILRTFKRQFQDMESDRAECRRHLLPTALADARGALARATDASQAFSGPLDDGAVETERRGALALLARAQEQFGTADSSQDLDGLRAAQTLAETVVQRFETLEQSLQRSDSEQLSLAFARAEQAVVRAEQEERQFLDLLADPDFAEARRRHPELTVPEASRSELDTIRRRLRQGASPSELDAVQRSAEAVAERLGNARRNAETVLRNPSAASPPTQDPTPPPVRTTPAVTLDPTPSPPATAVPPVETNEASELRRLRALGEALIDRLPPPAAGEELLRATLEATRTAAIESRGIAPGDTAAQVAHANALKRAVGHLQAVAGARAFLAGDPREAEAILGLETLPEGPIGAHAHLFRSAARFSLYRLSGELQPSLYDGAMEDARRTHELAPELLPEPRAFSPVFRDFFAETVGLGAVGLGAVGVEGPGATQDPPPP